VASPTVDDDNPVVEMAMRVWDGGRVTLGALDPLTGDGIRRGWLRPPADARALMDARARAVAFEEEIRRRNRRDRAAEADRSAPTGAADR
jgi:hypothetical protein